MKKLFIIFLITGSLHSQKLVDSMFTFKAVDNEIVWQKIFTSEIDDISLEFKIVLDSSTYQSQYECQTNW